MEYKFFNSKNHDRTYSAADWADYFASFVGNGVFANPASSCQVVSSEGRTVEVSPGKLWINGYMGSVTAPEAITLSASDADNPRIDRIAARLDLTHREVALAVLTGEPSSEPQAAELTRTDEIYEICLAEIYLGVGVTEITQADITDTRADGNICGWVTGLIDQIDATGLFAQYQSAFELWFDNLQNQLDQNQAANLQNQIDGVAAELGNKMDAVIVDSATGDSYTIGIENGLLFFETIGEEASE